MTRRMIRKRLARGGRMLRPWLVGLGNVSARYWPIAVAALGGMFVQRLLSRRSLHRAMAVPRHEEAPDTRLIPPSQVERTDVSESVEAWSPTAPNQPPPAL